MPRTTALLRRVAAHAANAMERHLPDAFIFAIGLTFCALALAVWLTGTGVADALRYWYGGITSAGFLTFAMQILLVVVTGYVVGTSPPVHRFIEWTSAFVHTPRGAYGFICFLTSAVMLLNWSLGLVVGGLYVRAVARRVRDVDYRVLCAAAFTGMLLWHGGFSGSIPLSLNTPGHAFVSLVGVISTRHTLFSPLNLITSAVLLLSLPVLTTLIAPPAEHVTLRIPHDALADQAPELPRREGFVAGLVHRRGLGLALGLTGLLGVTVTAVPAAATPAGTALQYVGYLLLHPLAVASAVARGLNLNMVFVILLFLGLVLHRSPAAFMYAMTRSIQNAAGVVYQFPLYGGIAGIMSHSGLAALLANGIVAHASAASFPALAFLAAGLVNMFVPSGGGQWLVQGELILTAARDLQVPAAKAAMAVAYGDAWTNMIQPFWSLLFVPIIGRGLDIRSQDFLGYALVAFVWSGAVWLVGVSVLPV